LIELHERLLKEVGEYIAGIRARPIIGTRVNPRDLSHSWQSHEPFTPKSPTRIGYRANGSKPT